MRVFSTSTSIVAAMLIFTSVSTQSAQAVFMNGDFGSNALINAGGGGAPLQYEDLDQGWVAKLGGSDWEISGGQLVQLARTGSETRVAQFWTNDLTGTGWSLQLTLGGPGNITSDNILLWGGVDDGNNTATQTVVGLGGDGPPQSNIVSGGWTELISFEDVPTGDFMATIAEDLGQYDRLVLMINSPRGSGQPGTGLTVDNVVFVSAAADVPEPASAVLALLGVAGLAARRRRLA